MEQHKKGIGISDLPKAFRDAIEITRALKLQYLWIDALCIIQQHGEGGKAGAAHADWNEEFSKMSDIYYNSYLTLAPLWANSVEDGLFSNQPQGVPLEGNFFGSACMAVHANAATRPTGFKRSTRVNSMIISKRLLLGT
uniref:Heterokaryon incompatibility domain-containing protein n=1 Tax=Fusarium oxysporum (strain Fo5176) TaxID=660025 RepID=A0A0D2YK05_FUSOF